MLELSRVKLYRGYYMVARRYEFYFWVAKQYFMNERSEWVKYCFCHEKIKFISSTRRVMFFLLYRQNDIDKIIEGNYQNYVTDKLTCEIASVSPSLFATGDVSRGGKFLLAKHPQHRRVKEKRMLSQATCEIMENKPLGSRMWFLWNLRVVYFPVKHLCLYNK